MMSQEKLHEAKAAHERQYTPEKPNADLEQCLHCERQKTRGTSPCRACGEPNEVERIVSDFVARFYGNSGSEFTSLQANYLRQILTPLIEDRDAKARDAVEQVIKFRDEEERRAFQFMDRERHYSVGVLDRLIKSLSHNIDLSELKE